MAWNVCFYSEAQLLQNKNTQRNTGSIHENRPRGICKAPVIWLGTSTVWVFVWKSHEAIWWRYFCL